jgi:hypothetical protein
MYREILNPEKMARLESIHMSWESGQGEELDAGFWSIEEFLVWEKDNSGAKLIEKEEKLIRLYKHYNLATQKGSPWTGCSCSSGFGLLSGNSPPRRSTIAGSSISTSSYRLRSKRGTFFIMSTSWFWT